MTSNVVDSSSPPRGSRSPRLRKLLIGVGVLALLIAAGLAWLVASFDANAYKSVAVDWMKTHRNRTLAIDGPVRLSVFPRIAVEVSGVTLSEKGHTDEFLALDQAALSVRLLPLLRKELVVDRVSVRGARMVYRRNAQGQANIDDFTAGAAPAAEPRQGQAMRFNVSRIQLDDLRLSVRDEQSQLSGEVTLDSLTAGRLADGIESPVEFDAELSMKSPAVHGRLAGKTLLTLDMAGNALRLREMRLGWKGNAFGVQAMDSALRGALSVDGRQGLLRADGIELDLSATLGPLKLAGSGATLQSFSYAPSAKTLSLAGLQLRIAGTQAGDPLRLSLDWPALAVTGDTLSGSAPSGTLSLAGPNAVEASFKSAAPSGNFDALKIPGLEVTLKGRSGPRQVGGTVRADLLLHHGHRSVTIDALKAQLQIQEPSLQPLALTLQGRADSSAAGSARWALDGQINTAPFHTEGSAIFAGTPTSVQLAARFDALDLNRLLPPETAGKPSGRGDPKSQGDTPVDLSGLRALQGRVNLSVGQLAYRNYRVNDAQFDATLEGGMLRVTRLAGKTWGGSVAATAFADARASRVALKATASGVDVNALLKDVAGKDLLEGTGRVMLDVDSAGHSVNELKARLQGSASLQLRDGAIKGVNLAKTLRQARAALAMKQDATIKASQTEKTDFSELSASFAIANGVARSSDLDLKSPFLRVGGDGALDIGKGRIDYTVRATAASTSKGQDGAELAALRGVTVPVRLTGPFEAIDWRIQWSALAAAALKSEVGGKLEDKLKERLREKLGVPSGAESAASAPEDRLKEKLRSIFK